LKFYGGLLGTLGYFFRLILKKWVTEVENILSNVGEQFKILFAA